MNSKSPSKYTESEEERIFKDIITCIDNSNSFCFQAGAGSGKTFSLIQSLEYLISKKITRVTEHKQKILCITYTNVAANEIKSRLGNTEVVRISTIHDWLWSVVAIYDRELLEIHTNELLEQIENIQKELLEEDWASKYSNLGENDKEELYKLLKENESIYNSVCNSNANHFREALKAFLSDKYTQLLSNMSNFGKVANRLFKRARYKETLELIEKREDGYKKIRYDSRYNTDRLHKMFISHETLLKYSNKLITSNDILKKIVIDKYPYILVDEYQDTNELVVGILSSLDDFGKEKVLIGYFGDPHQSIYENGIAHSLEDKHNGLIIIKKTINRRSNKKIINLANKLRADNLEQKTAYDDIIDGKVEFKIIASDNVENKINQFKEQWNISKENQLHCLTLKNENVAEKNGFKLIYDFFKKAQFYKESTNYLLLRDHILNQDLTKLGKVQLLLMNILDFREKVKTPSTIVSHIIPPHNLQKMDRTLLKRIIDRLDNLSGESLYDYLISIFELLNDSSNDESKILKKCLEYNISDEAIHSKESLYNAIKSELNLDENYEYDLDNFLKSDFRIFEKWYNFLYVKVEESTIYHTFHSTKGCEYNNVILVIDSQFGKDKKYFIRLFQEFKNNEKNKSMARNLLYVAATRAIENLAILYTEEIEDNELASYVEDFFNI